MTIKGAFGGMFLFTTGLMIALSGSMFFAGEANARSLVVTSAADSGTGTLREMVQEARSTPEDDTITFASGIERINFQSEIHVTPNTSGAMTIDGGGRVTLNGNNTSRMFRFDASNLITLRGLTFRNANPPRDSSVRYSQDGGAVFSESILLTVSNCTFTDNSALFGGAINTRGSLTVTSSTFADNNAQFGGAIFANPGTMTISDSTFTRNSAIAGSALFTLQNNSTVTNSTIANNATDRGNVLGSAIYVDGDDPLPLMEIRYSTITNNAMVNRNARAIRIGNGRVRLTGSVVAGNFPAEMGRTSGSNAIFESGGYNVIGDAGEFSGSFSGAGDITGVSAEDVFETDEPVPTSNGGSTQTVALKPGSLAINRIPADFSGAPGSDQRGVQRPQHSRLDSGSFEYDGAAPNITISPESAQQAEDGVPYSQRLTAAGSNGDYAFGVVSGALPEGLTLSEDGLLSGTPIDYEGGTYDFTVGATDASRFTGTRDFTLSVSSENDPPTFRMGTDQTVPEDAGPQSVTNFASEIDDGDPSVDQNVTFTVTNDDEDLFTAGGQPAISQNGTLTFTSAPDLHGVAKVTVVAEDDGGTANGGDDTSEEKTFNIAITSVNDAPVVVAGDPYRVDEDGRVTITLEATDADGDEIDFTTRSPANGSLRNLADAVCTPVPNSTSGASSCEATVTYIPDADFNGTDSFGLRASDGTLTSSLSRISVSVAPVNDPPTISAVKNQTIKINRATGLLKFALKDVDNPATSLKVSAKSSNTKLVKAGGIRLSGTGENRTVRVTPVRNQIGRATITLTVTDPGGLKATKTFTVTVNR